MRYWMQLRGIPILPRTLTRHTASQSQGYLKENGADKIISVTFKLTFVSTGPGGCVNATTEILMANFTYMQAQFIVPGDYVPGYNITTYAYQREEVLDP